MPDSYDDRPTCWLPLGIGLLLGTVTGLAVGVWVGLSVGVRWP